MRSAGCRGAVTEIGSQMTLPDGVMTSEELAKAWPSRPAEIEHASLETDDVPIHLRPLIPYARALGASDDSEWGHLIETLPTDLRRHLKILIATFNDQLDEWLAGPEADSTEWSDAYVAFSVLVMAV